MKAFDVLVGVKRHIASKLNASSQIAATDSCQERTFRISHAMAGLSMVLGLHGTASADEPIRIGLLAVEAGAFAIVQPFFDNASRLAVENFNSEGGILGRKVELVVYAHAGTPASAISTATRMVQQDRVMFVTGFLSTPMALALAPRMESLGGILLDSSTVSDDAISKACHANYFHLTAPDSQRTKALEQVVKESGVKRWNFLGSDYAMGHNARKQIESTIMASGAELKSVVFQPLGTTDFGTQINQIAATPAEGLVVAVPGIDAINLAKQQQQFGLFKRFKTVISLAFTEDVSLPGQGDSTVGVYTVQGWHFQSPGERVERFAKQYRERFGVDPGYLAGEAYSAYELIRMALQKAGDVNVKKVRDALAAIRGTTVLGDVAMRADHQLMRSVVVGRVESAGPGTARIALIRQEPAHSTAPPQVLTCN